MTQPEMPVVATQQTFTTPADTMLPKYAFVTSMVVTIIFTVLFWLPGFFCLVPATILSIMVSITPHPQTHSTLTPPTQDTDKHSHISQSPFPQALSKKESNKVKEARQFSIISFVLVLIFAVSYPILVVTVILATVFGYICDYRYRGYSYYYYRPYYCAR